MNEMKRVLALLLCFVMLVGYVPANAFAAEAETAAPSVEEIIATEATEAAQETTEAVPEELYVAEEGAGTTVFSLGNITEAAIVGNNLEEAVLFFSDLHTTKSDYKEDEIAEVFGGIAENADVYFSSAVSVGDAFSSNETAYSGSTAKITKAIRDALGDNELPVYYAWSDHDRGADIENFTGLLKDSGSYYIYTISMTDMGSAERYGVASTYDSSKLTVFTETVKGLDHTKPLFIVSHVPLHDRRNDNDYADEWYGVISEAAKEMDIAFFWGHNHTSETSADRSAYYVAKNGTETLAVEGLSSPVIPNFTYLNAGYMNDSQYNSSSTREYVATVVTLGEESINYTVYDANGEHKGTYKLNEDVVRDHAAKPELNYIGIEGESVYNVGDDLALVVKAYYSDGNWKDITEEANLTGYNMDVTGKYVVTAEYEGETYTYGITVNASDNGVTITTPGLTGIAVEIDRDAVYPQFGDNFFEVLNVTVEGQTAGQQLDYSVEVALDEGVAAEELSLFCVENGALTPVDYTVAAVDTEWGVATLTFTTDKTGTFVYGVLDVSIPEGAVLTELRIDREPDKRTYFPEKDARANGNMYLDIAGLEVTAVYTHQGKTYEKALDWDEFGEVADGYALSFGDLSVPGKKTVTVSYGGLTASFDVFVCAEGFVMGDVSVAFEAPAVTGLTVAAVEVTEIITTALEGLLSGELTVYDFTAEYSGMETVPEFRAAITVPAPANIAEPMAYYVSDDGSQVEPLETVVNADGTLTFYTSHFSTFVVGDKELVVNDPNTEDGSMDIPSTTTKTVYVLASGNPSGKVLIANSNAASNTTRYLLANNNGSVAATPVTIKSGDVDNDGSNEIYFELDNVDDELWTVSGSYTFKNGSHSLRYNSGLTLSTSNATTWSYSNNRLSYKSGFTTYYLNYNGSWMANNTQGNVYFYVPQTIEEVNTTTVSGTYSIAGAPSKVTQRSAVDGDKMQLHSTLTFVPNSGETVRIKDAAGVKYEIYEGGNASQVIKSITESGEVTFTGKSGNALVKVSYTMPNGKVVYNYIEVKAIARTYSLTIMLTENGATDMAAPEVTAGLKQVLDLSQTAVTYVDADGKVQVVADKKITWSVSNPDLLSVTDGKVSFKEGSVGQVVSVTAAYYNNGVMELHDVLSIDVVDTHWQLFLSEPDSTSSTGYRTITAPIALKEIEEDDTYQLWAVIIQDGVDLKKLDADKLKNLEFISSNEAIATADAATGIVTFTGKEGTVTITAKYTYDKDEFGNPIAVTDTVIFTVSANDYFTPEDGTDDFPEYPAEGSVRFDKTASAVGNFSETGLALVELSMTGVPFGTNKTLDVVLMLDRSSSMYKSGVQHRISDTVTATKAFVQNIVKNEDGTYNNNRVIVMDFLGGNLAEGSKHKYESNLYTLNESSGYEIISSDTELAALFKRIDDGFKGQTSLYGTEYAQGLEDCYNALKASRADGNQQFCVFMSDGIPNYMKAEKTHFESTRSIVAMFDVSNYNSSSAVATRNATKYEYEYYSTLMKNEGVTVYTVGLGLANTNSAWSNASAAACEQVANMLLNDIAGPAFETTDQRDTGKAVNKLNKYFFSVADANAAAGMKDVFENIAGQIIEAKDVVVTDKVGSDYNLNFKMPNGIDTTATNGLANFYLQVVEYELDEEFHERVGSPKVKENFTFSGEDGNLISHTVDGKECASCNHVTGTNGNITAIKGTYFTYDKTSDGEFLTWYEAKITSNELALQYFAYLENSAGVDVNKQVAAGTYYTNDFAYLDYTNHKGNKVHQVFPRPQMTWNGAQVSYTFYLVNERGEPVNSAGLVVPFAEATYVTDVFTYNIIWNNLEQAAGLEAVRLADDLVPSVYRLYDPNASYSIHVYEDEDAVNLNNHFVIGGGVKVDNKTTNYTTYVFNNKSDAVKYTVSGTYITNDGTDSIDSTSYLCKSYSVNQDAFEFKQASGVTFENFVAAAYHVLQPDGTYLRALEFQEGVTYYTLALKEGATPYNAVAGETQWAPGAAETYTGGTKIGDYIYYVDENSQVYTIVMKTNGQEAEPGFDFSNTTVAFAVVWEPALVEDTVVVDYGLDVVIDVTRNDNTVPGVVGVRANAPKVNNQVVDINSGTYYAGKLQNVDVYIDADRNGTKELKVGTATVESRDAVRFSMDESNGMQFSEPAVFYYEGEVQYYNDHEVLETKHMYTSVTVIPATTVYYEDDFVTLSAYKMTYDEVKAGDAFDSTKNYFVYNKEGNLVRAYGLTEFKADVTYYVQNHTQKDLWKREANKNLTQQVDRPGEDKIGDAYDADNVYGYDEAYKECSTFSMNGYAKINVTENTYGLANFDFYGTGFDVISLTSADTGSITVKVTGEGISKNFFVDTYYGYKYENDEWVVDPSADDALYQIPVIKVSGLTYGKYTVEIKAAYNSLLDHKKDGSYDFYLDAIRIYDPTGDENNTANGAYGADKESWPIYEEFRELLIEKPGYQVVQGADGTYTVTGSGTELKGAIFIDGKNGNTSIADYTNYGPNNEIYLKSGQAVAFKIRRDSAIADVQVSMKSADGSTVNVGLIVNGKDISPAAISTATDRYYSIGSYLNSATENTIIFRNAGGGIVSLTNLKVTFTENPGTLTVKNLLVMDTQTAEGALNMLRPDAVEEEIPESTVPEETEPEITEPEETLSADLQVNIREKTVKVGSSIVVKATTSSDVDALTVNGQQITHYTENRRTGVRTWTITVKAEEAGDLYIEVSAYSAKGQVLETAVQQITVTGKKANVVEQVVGTIVGVLLR